MPVDVALKHATSEEHTYPPYVSPSPLEGGPAFYPGVLARGAGTRDPLQASADSLCSDLYPFTPSDDLLQAPSLTSHTSKKWAEASRIRSTPPLPPLQSSASSGPGDVTEGCGRPLIPQVSGSEEMRAVGLSALSGGHQKSLEVCSATGEF